jgi:CHAD domain-containing protein
VTKLTYDIPYSINIDTFFDNYVHNIQKVDNRLDEYIKDPIENNIHDIRTSIRRLEASYRVSPKQIRKRKIVEFVIKSKRLFKINSEIRDFDIILEKLIMEGQMTNQQLDLLKLIKRSRDRKLKNAISLAHELRDLDVPHVENYKNHSNPILLQNKLTKRYTKVVSKFASKMEKTIPIVLSGNDKIEELHEVRKDTKKLRYLLELVLNNSHKSDQSTIQNSKITKTSYSDNQNILIQIEKLKKIQDMLGNIHDYDITIAYLQKYDKQKNFVTDMNISKQRKNKYEQFVQYYKSVISNIDNNFFMSM